MAVGTTLANLRKYLNAEIEDEMDEGVANAGIDRKNQLLNANQLFLANQHTYLRGKTWASVPITPGSEFFDFPAGIDISHLDKPAFTIVANWRYKVYFGINPDDFNIFNSDLNVQAKPVMKWDWFNVDNVLKIRIWPISNAAQTLQISGLLPITPMVSDSDTCVIDDMAIVFFTAAQMLAKRGAGDAGAELAKANAYLASLRSGKPSRYETFNIAGEDWGRRAYTDYKRPVVAVGGGTDAGSGGTDIGIGIG